MENLSAEEALAAGFLGEIVEAEELDRRVCALCARLAQHAPITMRVSKEAIGRLLHAGLPHGDDLVRACYGSDDFRLGVEAFVDKRAAMDGKVNVAACTGKSKQRLCRLEQRGAKMGSLRQAGGVWPGRGHDAFAVPGPWWI